MFGDAVGDKRDQADIWLSEKNSVRLISAIPVSPKVVRATGAQPEKPFLQDAIQFIKMGQEAASAAVALERRLRMRLRDFVKVEEELVADFLDLDEAREEYLRLTRDSR